MLPFLAETLRWAWDYVQHVVIMFYWFWVPAFLVVGVLGLRYRPRLEEITLEERRGDRAFWAAVGWGMTSRAGRMASLETAQTLWRLDVSPHVVLAFLGASQNLGLYSLVLFTVLIGLEFGVGVALGGLVMIGLVRVMAPAPPARSAADRAIELASMRDGAAPTAMPASGALVSFRTGWRRVLRDIGRYLRNVGLSLLGGLALGALVLAVDQRGAWILPKWMGDETVGAALAGSFFASLLAVPLFLAPGGILIVASSIWKTWTLAYSGLISFVLMSLLNPLTGRALLAQYGLPRGWGLVVALYLSAALAGLVVTGVFALLGVPVTHVPWFRDLVDRIIMTLPFTTVGAPPGMKGM